MPIRLDTRAPDFSDRFRALLAAKREVAADVGDALGVLPFELAHLGAEGDGVVDGLIDLRVDLVLGLVEESANAVGSGDDARGAADQACDHGEANEILADRHGSNSRRLVVRRGGGSSSEQGAGGEAGLEEAATVECGGHRRLLGE